MRFNGAMRLHADLEFNKLSNKAQNFYYCTEPITLYKNGDKFYVRGAINFDALSFKELNTLFENMYDEIQK